MNTEVIERDFREKVCEKLTISTEGIGRFRVFTPFMFEDGDHLAIVLKKENGTWILSDEGHTYMHLTYDLDEKDIQRGTRQKIITNALSVFYVQDREGELIIPIEDNKYGDALYSFVQALLRITDVTYLSRERVRSTFMEDFQGFMEEIVPESRRSFDWHDPVHDPGGNLVYRSQFLSMRFLMTIKLVMRLLPYSNLKSGMLLFVLLQFSRTRSKLTARYLPDSAMSVKISSQALELIETVSGVTWKN